MCVCVCVCVCVCIERQRPGDIPRKPRIQWPKGNQTASWKN